MHRRRSTLSLVSLRIGFQFLESWAHSVPVLAARIGALPELIELGGAGWLFDAGSSTSLVRALRTILGDNSCLSAAAAKCHGAVSKFSKEKWLSSINSILQQTKIEYPKGARR